MRNRRQLSSMIALVTSAAIYIAAAPAVAGVTKCKARIDPKSGAIEIRANNVTGSPVWGPNADQTGFAFFNEGSCHQIATQRLSGCNIADVARTASRTPPEGCVIWINDDSGDPACPTYIKGCTVLAGGTDGVVQISQDRALAGGVTPTDTPGFPVRIDTPGSYRLTSDLDVSGEPAPENVIAIDIAASDVTLDLNGFNIRGPVTGCPELCSVVGIGDGIAYAGGIARAVVMNGRVTGMGRYGIDLPAATIVRNVHLSTNAGGGVRVGARSMITDSIAGNNGDFGITATGNLTASRNIVQNNAGDGISTSSENLIAIDNIVYDNEGGGIVAAAGCNASGNILQGNGGGGIEFGDGVASRNVVLENGDGESGTAGIYASGSATIHDNSVRDQAEGAGIEAAHAVVHDNTVIGNHLSGIELMWGVARGNSSRDNNTGIKLTFHASIVGNTTTDNFQDGIDGRLGQGTFADNTSVGNGSEGISIGGGTARHNTVADNDSIGIDFGLLSGVATGNTAILNDSLGFDFTSADVGYGGNAVQSTITGGTVSISGGHELSGNLCDGTIGCP